MRNQQYRLTYYLASTDKASYADNQFRVFIDGKEKKKAALSNVSVQGYTPYTLVFKAKGSSTEIKFGYKTKYNFLFLDDVSVQPVSNDVLEDE